MSVESNLEIALVLRCYAREKRLKEKEKKRTPDIFIERTACRPQFKKFVNSDVIKKCSQSDLTGNHVVCCFQLALGGLRDLPPS